MRCWNLPSCVQTLWLWFCLHCGQGWWGCHHVRVSQPSCDSNLLVEDLRELCAQRELARSMSFCAGLEEADVNVGVESPLLVGSEKGRHWVAFPALGWEQSRQQGGVFLLSHPCPLLKGLCLNQTQLEEKVLFMISFDYFFLLFYFIQLLLHLLLRSTSCFLSSSLHV